MSEASRAVTFADSKNRFSSRVADYLRYRPHYPIGVLELLREHSGLSSEHAIADIGSGTGFLAELFLQNGNPVFGVEPNKEMREAGEEYLAAYPRFTSINASAEATTLPAASVDFVTAGQAFHWFAPEPTRREFARILRPAGWVAIVWNDRSTSATSFADAYEDLLQRYGTDYARVKDSYPQAKDIRAFFEHENFLTREIPNYQIFDLDGLRGRLPQQFLCPGRPPPEFRAHDVRARQPFLRTSARRPSTHGIFHHRLSRPARSRRSRVMKILYSWLQDFVALTASPEELASRLSLSGNNVAGIENGAHGAVIDAEVTSNRPDCLSHYGIARELGALYKLPLKQISPKPAETAAKAADAVKVEIRSPELCGRFTARVIRGVKIQPSPAWLKDRVEACGVASINNVVDVSNYVMLELGHPLHTFDYDKIRDHSIVPCGKTSPQPPKKKSKHSTASSARSNPAPVSSAMATARGSWASAASWAEPKPKSLSPPKMY